MKSAQIERPAIDPADVTLVRFKRRDGTYRDYSLESCGEFYRPIRELIRDLENLKNHIQRQHRL